MAVSARARPRATKDIDFLIDADKDFFKSILPKLVSTKGYKFKIFKGDLLDPINGLMRVYDEDGNEFIDFIPVFWNWQRESIANAEEIEIFGGVKIPIARIEDLVVLKLKAGGPQDMLDVEELFKAVKQGESLDKERLINLAKRARVDKKLKRFL